MSKKFKEEFFQRFNDVKTLERLLEKSKKNFLELEMRGYDLMSKEISAEIAWDIMVARTKEDKNQFALCPNELGLLSGIEIPIDFYTEGKTYYFIDITETSFFNNPLSINIHLTADTDKTLLKVLVKDYLIQKNIFNKSNEIIGYIEPMTKEQRKNAYLMQMHR